MLELFHTVFYQPIFNGLMLLQRFVPGHDLGLSIILLTIAIRAILMKPSLSQIKSSQALQELQPKLKALQKQFAKDRQELARQTMKLYREHKVNPMSSCLPLLIQFPFLIAVYQVFNSGLQPDPSTHLLQSGQLNDLYGSLRAYYAETPINTTMFGFLDLSLSKNIVLTILVAGTQFLQTRMLTPKTSPPTVPGSGDEQMATTVTRQMNYIFPLVFAWIAYTLPAGIGLYFLTFNLFSMVQQWFVIRAKKPQLSPPL